jgi:hypothetical protein
MHVIVAVVGTTALFFFPPVLLELGLALFPV